MSKEELIGTLEEGIVKLIDDFLEKPYAFYTENDLHCHLYHILCLLGLNKPCRVRLNGETVESTLLHKEYPTERKYRRHPDRKSEVNEQKGKRGHFDLCIWDPTTAEQRTIRRSKGRGQRILSAVEFSLWEENRRNFQWHVDWDLQKLTDPLNEVERGYVLFFVRDYPYSVRDFPENGFIARLCQMFGPERRVPIIYVEEGPTKRKGLISKAGFQDYLRLEP